MKQEQRIPNLIGMTTNELYKRMIEEIQDYAIIVIDCKGIIQNWNRGAEKIKGYREEEVIGKHFSIFYLPEDRNANLPQILLKQAEDAGRAGQEGWRRRKDGSRFWASITITAIHGPDNNVVGFCKVTRDLSDKKQREDSLRLSEERYHKMISEVQDYAIILLNTDGIVQNWNAGAQNIKGYTAAEAVGNSFEMFYTIEDRASGLPHTLLNRAKQNGKATQEGWRVRKDGSRFWGSITITALHDEQGEVIGYSKVTRDLTQQKMAEEKLAEYLAELELQNSELEQFAYVASHDLQEPLRKIQTFTELISENYEDRQFVERYLGKLDASAKRMAELVRSLLNYSRLSKVRDNPAGENVDLNELVADVRQDFELLIEEKRAVIQSGKLPVVTGNKMQLGQLFANLVSNSLKFSTADPVIHISCKVVNREHVFAPVTFMLNSCYYELTFQDNGIGFEEQYNKIIFSLFQRLHKKHEYAGTGIGLALCKKIAENHNGTIVAASEPGKGATFKVYLPCE